MHSIRTSRAEFDAGRLRLLLRERLGKIGGGHTRPLRTAPNRKLRNVVVHSAFSANATDPTEDLCRVLRVHYLRPDGKAAGFGLHVWGPGAIQETAWEAPLSSTGYSPPRRPGLLCCFFYCPWSIRRDCHIQSTLHPHVSRDHACNVIVTKCAGLLFPSHE